MLLPSLLPLCFCLLQLQPKCYTGHSSSTVLNNMFAGNAKHSLLTMYNVIYTFKAFVFRRVTVLYTVYDENIILYIEHSVLYSIMCILYSTYECTCYIKHSSSQVLFMSYGILLYSECALQYYAIAYYSVHVDVHCTVILRIFQLLYSV